MVGVRIFCKQQRPALQARTMGPSQNNIRRLSIVDLPEDVLREIFDYFKEDIYYPRGEINYYHRLDADDGDFKNVQNLRLVCRYFSKIASSLLVPVVRANISSESLLRIDGLTNNPRIAAGVRLVQVVLAYRPKEVAETFSLYRKLQSKKVEEVADRCDYYTEFARDRENAPDHIRKILNARKEYYKIMSAWDGLLNQKKGDDGIQANREYLKYKEVLNKCYDEYRYKHEDQYRLLTDGSFAETLAASISRMTSLRAVSFFDHEDRPLDEFFDEGVTILANDTDRLREILVMPQDWIAIEDMKPIPKLLPAKLLWELPVAIHERGKQLREIAIGSLPTRSNFNTLCPVNRHGTQPAWDRLPAAFQYIQKVGVGRGGNMRRQTIRREHLLAKEQAHMNNYFTALLSGPCLELIDIDLYVMHLNFGLPQSGTSAKDMIYRFGSVFSSGLRPQLRSIALCHVSFRERELEQLFSGLSGKLEYMYLYDVGVLDGGWAHLLDVLREKLLSGHSHKKCSVELTSLCGGIFDSLPDDHVDDIDIFDEDYDFSHVIKSEKTKLHRDAEKYVSGTEGMVNPLTKLEAKLEYTCN
ncbi:hypothetical protein AJ79_02843 [Helicocarpus griseus UAMH5409]|uniref:F-box domain-containing protein n=1 Tax=Helicocarpus griseus UAMH5409 TaxID=1447875 RepID=A0A2B7Y1T7_9EURO|nr:hypothetical protein AJ79_02843 [Helicocarpus griseus UAMH5409]